MDFCNVKLKPCDVISCKNHHFIVGLCVLQTMLLSWIHSLNWLFTFFSCSSPCSLRKNSFICNHPWIFSWESDQSGQTPNPIPFMYGIFTYIWLIFYDPNVGKYTVRPMDPSWEKQPFGGSILMAGTTFGPKNPSPGSAWSRHICNEIPKICHRSIWVGVIGSMGSVALKKRLFWLAPKVQNLMVRHHMI